MQTGSSGTLIGWKSGQTIFIPLWDRMEGAWLRTQGTTQQVSSKIRKNCTGGGGVNYVVKGIKKIHQYPNVKICEM